MRILANAADLLPNNGIWTQTLQVNEELARRGHRIDLLYLQDGPQRENYAGFCNSMQKVRRLDLELEVRPLIHDGPRVLPAVWAGVRSHPDVIYVNRYRPLPWALATRAFVRAPVVCHVHGYVGIDVPRINRALSRFTARFLCVSRYVRTGSSSSARTRNAPMSCTTVSTRPTTPRAAWLPRAGAPSARPAGRGVHRDVLWPGGSGQRHRHPGRGARGTRGQSEFSPDRAIGGGAQLRTISSPALFGAASTPVHQLPMRTDVVTPLHAADLVVAPSHSEEAFGRVVIEALATGRPVDRFLGRRDPGDPHRRLRPLPRAPGRAHRPFAPRCAKRSGGGRGSRSSLTSASLMWLVTSRGERWSTHIEERLIEAVR